ncbi:MAG: hypothetical protein LBP33_05720 [Candidatus Adiutrix sp.]|jgi:hypothetical protein|nr:hypothetical protein [Candidatus Adiutrix sp.]
MEKKIHRLTKSLFAKVWEDAVRNADNRLFLAATVNGQEISMEVYRHLGLDAAYEIAESFWDGIDRYKAIC